MVKYISLFKYSRKEGRFFNLIFRGKKNSIQLPFWVILTQILKEKKTASFLSKIRLENHIGLIISQKGS